MGPSHLVELSPAGYSGRFWLPAPGFDVLFIAAETVPILDAFRLRDSQDEPAARRQAHVETDRSDYTLSAGPISDITIAVPSRRHAPQIAQPGKADGFCGGTVSAGTRQWLPISWTYTGFLAFLTDIHRPHIITMKNLWTVSSQRKQVKRIYALCEMWDGGRRSLPVLWVLRV